MAKSIYPYSVFTATDIYSRSSATGTMTNQSTYVDFTDITVSNVKTILSETSTSISDLCTSGNINVWSKFSPKTLLISSNQIATTVSAPYKLGDFAGYNHNAITPYVSDYADTVYGTANQSVTYPLELAIGELDYTDIGIYKVKATLKESSTTLGSSIVAINEAGNTNNSSSVFVPIQIDWTVPSGWISNKTLTIELDYLNSTDIYKADYPVSAFTANFTYNNPPQLVGEVLAASEGGWDLANVTWTGATINTSGQYNMGGIQIDIDGSNYTGNAKVDIYKVGESRTYLGTYSFTAPPTVYGTAPFSVGYNETVYLYFYQP